MFTEASQLFARNCGFGTDLCYLTHITLQVVLITDNTDKVAKTQILSKLHEITYPGSNRAVSPIPFYYFIAPLTHIAQPFLHLRKYKKPFFELKVLHGF